MLQHLFLDYRMTRSTIIGLAFLSADALTAASLIAQHPGVGPSHHHSAGQADSAFARVQERGRDVMGVDQYSSTHRFDALPDGGRVELQRDTDDSLGVAQIRGHMREIEAAFQRADFGAPAAVHAQAVPGTETMAKLRREIRYTVTNLPRGAELRIRSSNPEAIAAIHAFIAFQRRDHRAGGVGPAH